ncbi:sulfotransferase domain-containing protein [Rhizobium alvei]|uniref:Sulfotransferase domain-containing protein n=1 Tax=Rhizobium alvei TaxID=1132659 RepID=A0ABT8YMD9_9HYPH|nr:sulfotransferase domain-containing protein [Rhizobium alvei]MDO6964390.1 sulfotransferase domain-containing protein [Rhizobium alvei]
MPQNIIWLASYPKSGNTWLRAFISSILGLGTINDKGAFARFTSTCNSSEARALFYGDQPMPEVLPDMAWRAPLQRQISARVGASRHFCKTHSRFGTIDGNPLIAPDVSLRAVVIVRNPIDVAASFANYMTTTPEMGIKLIANPFMTLSNRNRSHYMISVGSWDLNVLSWLTQSEIPVFLMRYEDMYFDKETAFGNFARQVLGIRDQAKIDKAIEESDFGRLQAREQEVGFRENISSVNPFFWRGYPYHALEIYDEAQRQAIWDRHRIVAEALGYRYDGKTITLEAPDMAPLHAYRQQLLGLIDAPYALPPELMAVANKGS